MATEPETTETGRILRAQGIVDTPDATPVVWSPPVLRPAPGPVPLEMRLDTKEDQAKPDPRQTHPQEHGMVLVTGGDFLQGDEEGGPDERPAHTVFLSTYWIDKFPVTNEDYKDFVDAAGHRKPTQWTNGTYPLEEARLPVTNVSWDDAAAYSTWAGKRLPTEAEWEKAARGTKGQTYPWGDAFRKDNVNSSNDYDGLTSVDEFPGGDSPYGAMDMCGNAFEWCSDWYQRDFYETSLPDNPEQSEGGKYRVVRGGFYGESRTGVRCAARGFAPPANQQDHIGFRCVKSPSQSAAETPSGPDRVDRVQPAAAPPIEPPRPVSEEDSLEQIAAARPELVAKLIRTLLIEQTAPNTEDVGDGYSPLRKAAILLVSLGEAAAGSILQHLKEEEVRQAVLEVADVEVVTGQQKRVLFDEARTRLVAEDYVDIGGVDYARSMVEQAYGPRRAPSVLERIAGGVDVGGLSLLHDVEPQHFVSFFGKEHPQAIALILTQLTPVQAAGVINRLPDDLANDVVHRIATMDNVRPKTLKDLSDSLSGELQAILAGEVTLVGGPKALAEMLNSAGKTTRRGAVESLESRDPELAEEVWEQMFVFDDIAKLTNGEVKEILKKVDTKDLATALKGGSVEMQDRVFSNLSDEAGGKIKEQMQASGPERLSDVEKVQLQIVHVVRQLEEAGKVTIVRGDSGGIFV